MRREPAGEEIYEGYGDAGQPAHMPRCPGQCYGQPKQEGELSQQTGGGQPNLLEAMRMLNSLPASVKGCLLEAARLCGAAAGLAQDNVLHSWAAQACTHDTCMLFLSVTLGATAHTNSHH